MPDPRTPELIRLAKLVKLTLGLQETYSRSKDRTALVQARDAEARLRRAVEWVLKVPDSQAELPLNPPTGQPPHGEPPPARASRR